LVLTSGVEPESPGSQPSTVPLSYISMVPMGVESNNRPAAYETAALPLSYTGILLHLAPRDGLSRIRVKGMPNAVIAHEPLDGTSLCPAGPHSGRSSRSSRLLRSFWIEIRFGPLLRSSTYPPLRRGSARILRSSSLLLRLTRRRARCTGPFLYLRLFIAIALFPS
jgi:hypothetical protein